MTNDVRTRVKVGMAVSLLAGAAVIGARGDAPAQDVPFVPSPEPVVKAMLDLAQVGPRDVLYDLGSGDGRIVIAAAERGARRAVGIDSDPARIQEARKNAARAGVEDEVRFVQGDLFEADLKDATVVSMYLLSTVNLELRPKLLAELRPGTRIVSHDFDMEDWKPDRTGVVNEEGRQSTVYLWIVPARVGGEWTGRMQTEDGQTPFTLTLDQRYQQARGTLEVGDRRLPVRATLAGPRLQVTADDGNGGVMRIEGQVSGRNLEGKVQTPNGSARPLEGTMVRANGNSR